MTYILLKNCRELLTVEENAKDLIGLKKNTSLLIENERIKKIGLYTPDFLIIKREKNMINKVLIVETKGKGFSTQQEFLDRRNYVENDFIKFNNKKYGYSKFDYLYIEDTLKDNDIIEKLNEKIKNFFKEEK